MLSCEEAARLTSESLDRPLTRGERFSLGFHKLICSACRVLEGKFRLIDSATLKVVDPEAPVGHECLPDTCRQSILEEIGTDTPPGGCPERGTPPA